MSKTFKIVTTVVIVILAFVTILFTVVGAAEMIDGMNPYAASEDSLLYALQDGRYGYLVRSYYRNTAVDAAATETMEECYAVAKYYEAAIDYRLAVQENDHELLEKSKERMDNAADEMGELSYAKDEIDIILGVE